MIDSIGRKHFQKLKERAASTSGIITIAGISESRSAAVAAQIADARGGQTMIVTSSYGRAKRIAEDLPLFVEQKILLLPDEERSHMAYDAKSHHGLIERLTVLTALAKGEECIVVAPVLGAVKKIAPKEIFCRHAVSLKIGEEAETEQLRKKFSYMGYERVSLVETKGQFSIRGGILDIYPPDLEYPCRIEFFDTEVDSIRYFDPSTQRSLHKAEEIRILPAEQIIRDEFLFEQAATRIKSAYEAFGHKLSGEKREILAERLEHILEYLSTGTNIQYLENYIPYFYEEVAYLWDYLLPSSTLIIDDPDRISELLKFTEKEFGEDFKNRLDRGEVIPEDYRVFSGENDFKKAYRTQPSFFLTPFHKNLLEEEAAFETIEIHSKQAPVFNGRMDFLETELLRCAKLSYDVIIACSTEDRVRNMKDFLERCKLEKSVLLREAFLSGGMEFPEEKLIILCDKDIFATAKYKKQRKESGERRSIKAFTDIRKGDYIVHENHGIGKFIETTQMEVQGIRRDYLKISYAGSDFLYVPVDQMDMIQKYSGADGSEPKISKLGGTEWRKTKERVKAAIKDMAKELIALSAERQLEQGHAFSKDTIWQAEFEDLFPYQETPDQLRCVKEIKKDMERPIAMDRLLCGDVGYGKTEVAARAVFKCAGEGKQAAILVPTTLLANQHYLTFKQRFEAFPMKVEMLSRFRSEKQKEDIIEKTKKGEIDVLIGTHRLLSKDIAFKDLGLLVIDEEQHFGVQHKEAIKMIRKNVDVLTLSATPIPRTLHMSLVGIRDISLIEDPPEERYPVQTYVTEQDDQIIREAIEREIDRNGQVYVIYNRVKGIQKIASHISNLVPSASVIAAHGQMDEKQLEDIMLDFIGKRYNVLVATTIIESGIDIPNVNTIVLLDADRFGLSQLYQLRGRVGRSNKMAYAYLMYQKNKMLTEVAEKRLRAIREFTEFGAGFHIAMRDLEIRGAGNILGAEQHGHMMMIGYELYCKLVEDAVHELSGTTSLVSSDEEISVDIGVEGYIPSEYIDDELMKLTMYKKIASIRDDEDAEEVVDELIDRFGDIPKMTMNLISIGKIKALAKKAGIAEVRKEKNKLVFYFAKSKGPDPELLSGAVSEYGMYLLLHGGQRPYLKLTMKKNDSIAESTVLLTKLIR
ncbi:MAG: transcription-repair coupling factor [Eubacteriales bacterium]|nr:transcription-repair coupling factor [Eubacteriales bacterium]